MRKTGMYIDYENGELWLVLKFRVGDKKYEFRRVRLLMNRQKKSRLRSVVIAKDRKYHILVKRVRSGLYECIVTYDIPDPRHLPLVYPIAGIDLNKYKIAVSVVDENLDLLEQFDVDISEIYNYRLQQKDHRMNIIGHVVKSIFKHLKKKYGKFSVIIGYPYGIIKFKTNRDFPYRKIMMVFLSRAARMKIPIRIVNESYTSRYARSINLPGDIHQKAAYAIVLKYLRNLDQRIVKAVLKKPKI